MNWNLNKYILTKIINLNFLVFNKPTMKYAILIIAFLI